MKRTDLVGDLDVTITSQQMGHQLDGCDPLSCVLFSHSPSVQVYYALRCRLEASSESWLQEFIELDGLDSLLDSLGHMRGSKFTAFSDAILQIDCLSCIRAVLNTHVGMEALANSQDGILKLLRGMDLANTLPRKQVLEILSAVCVYSNVAYKKLLKALDRNKRENHLYHRFSFVINELKVAETIPHKTAVLTFINAIIQATSDVSKRCQIRNEFIGLTLLDVLSFLRREDSDEDLSIQLQVFQEKKHEDENTMDLETNLDLSSPQDLADAIQAKVFGGPKMVSFVNILQDLLAIETSEKEKSDTLWQVLERHVHHIVHGFDDVDSLAGMDTEVVCQVVAEMASRSTDNPAPEAETSLAKRQLKRFVTSEEAVKAERQTSYMKTATKISVDSGYVGCDDRFSPPGCLKDTQSNNSRSPVKRRRSNSSSYENPNIGNSSPGQNKISGFNIRKIEDRGKRESMYDNMSPAGMPLKQALQHRLIQNKMSKDINRQDKISYQKLNVLCINESRENKADAVQNLGTAKSKNDNSGDCMKGQSPQAVPCPSPNGRQNFMNFIRNKLAFPAFVMRNLKWIKLDDGTIEKYPRSVWANAEACQPTVEPDYLHLEEMFREKNVFDDSMETPLLSHKTRINLNLFLNRLEEEPTELVKRLACLDGPGLSLPFIKHLVEILPDHSEVKHLKYYNGNLLNLGQAEQFVLHLSDLPDYNTLLIGHLRRAEFAVTVPHLKSLLTSMLEVCKNVLSSKNLRETLILILRMGNFLNHGQYNGYASGFKLSSLSRLADVKSREPGHNLVHFFVSMAESTEDKLLDFLSQIPQFEKAASCSPANIKAEFDKINTNINAFIRQLASANPVVKEGFHTFMEEVKKEFRELQSQITELKYQSMKLAEYFCESDSFEIQTCFKQLLDFLKQLRSCRQEVQLLRKQKNLATRHSSMFSEQIRNKGRVLRFGLEAGASSSMMEEKKQLVEHLLAELHRGNFQPSIRQASQAQPCTDNGRTQEKERTPVRDGGPTSCAATPDRGQNPMELSHISLQGTPMMNRPNSELYDEELTLTALSARSKIVTSSVKHLPDIATLPTTGPIKVPPVFALENSFACSASQRSKTHHRSRSDLGDSISATTKWIRYHQQALMDNLQAPLARPESSMTLATLNLESGSRRFTNQAPIALTPGPTVERPPVEGQRSVDVEIFDLVRNGKKGERKSGTFSNFFNKISKRVLRQRSSSDQNAEENAHETGCEKLQQKAAPRGTASNQTAGKGSNLRGKVDDKENVCDPDHNPFDRQKKNPIRLSNRFKGKLAK